MARENILTPPISRVVLRTIETRDPSIAAEQMAAIYGRDARIGDSGKPAEFSMRAQAASFCGLILAKLACASWSLIRETRGSVSLAMPLHGVLHYGSGSGVLERHGSTDIAVGRPFATTRARVERCEGLNLIIPVDGLRERAERLTGESHGASLIYTMVDRIDAASPAGQALSRSLRAAMVEIAGLDSLGLGALAASGYADLLLNLSVACLFPSVTNSLAAAPRSCGPAVLGRARDYIQAHAGRPIDLSRLCADLGVSMRALQENFQRFCGLSPRDYILECRLEKARQRLLMPDRAASVTRIALDCGFGDLSFFSAKYREKFAELPSETLAAARRLFR